MTDTSTISAADRTRFLESVDEILQQRRSSLHVPSYQPDGEVIPACNTAAADPSNWRMKSPSVYPNACEMLCDDCVAAWLAFGANSIPVPLTLTHRQYEVFEAAYTKGYFEWPRNAELRDIADYVGIEQSTSGEHLRYAIKEFIDHVFAADGQVKLEEAQLTAKQQEVLETAYQDGYFEWPRGITKAEVADILDISPATANQHIRVALKKLLDSTAVVEDQADSDICTEPEEGAMPRIYQCPSPDDCSFTSGGAAELADHVNTEHSGEYRRDGWPDTPAARAATSTDEEENDVST